jgi:hypothetical protein
MGGVQRAVKGQSTNKRIRQLEPAQRPAFSLFAPHRSRAVPALRLRLIAISQRDILLRKSQERLLTLPTTTV